MLSQKAIQIIVSVGNKTMEKIWLNNSINDGFK